MGKWTDTVGPSSNPTSIKSAGDFYAAAGDCFEHADRMTGAQIADMTAARFGMSAETQRGV